MGERSGDFTQIPRLKDVLYRLPWYVGLICSGYLVAVHIVTDRMYPLCAKRWWEGGFRESYIASSILLYSIAACLIVSMIPAFTKYRHGRRDYIGSVLIMLYIVVLLFFAFCLIDKIHGFVIWPFYRF